MLSPLIIGSVVVGKIVFEIAFNEYLPAYPFFVVLVLGIWSVLLLRPFSFVLMTLGHPWTFFVAKVISIVVCLPLILIFVRIGAFGIAIVWILMDTIWSVLMVIFCKRYIKLNVDWKKTILFLVSAIATVPVILVEIHYLPSLYAFLISIPTLFGIYIVFVRLLGLVTKRDVSLALNFLPEGLTKKIASIVSRE